jgi:hypothetical protein
VGISFKKKIFQLFKELQDRKVVDNFNVTSVHYLLDKICINTNYLEVICFKKLSRSPSSMKDINCLKLFILFLQNINYTSATVLPASIILYL